MHTEIRTPWPASLLDLHMETKQIRTQATKGRHTTMTIAEQKIAVLEWAGWSYGEWTNPKGAKVTCWRRGEGELCWGEEVPPIDTSLDAIAETVAHLEPDLIPDYLEYLQIITQSENRFEVENRFALVSATAPQRLEALCRTLFPERWKE
jgi:hypothetical protein